MNLDTDLTPPHGTERPSLHTGPVSTAISNSLDRSTTHTHRLDLTIRTSNPFAYEQALSDIIALLAVVNIADEASVVDLSTASTSTQHYDTNPF